MDTQPTDVDDTDTLLSADRTSPISSISRWVRRLICVLWPRFRDAWIWCIEWTAGLTVWGVVGFSLLIELIRRRWKHFRDSRQSEHEYSDDRSVAGADPSFLTPATDYRAAIGQRRVQFLAGPRREAELSFTRLTAVSAVLLLLGWYCLTPGRETAVTFDGSAVSLTPQIIGPEPHQQDTQPPADLDAVSDTEDSTDQIARQLKEAERMRAEALEGLPPALQDAIRNPDADIEDVLVHEIEGRGKDDRAVSRTGANLATRAKPAHNVLARNIVAELFQLGSDKCEDRGYRSLRFGSSIDEVRRQLDFEGTAENEWLGSDEGGLYFEDGKLRGIRKVYPHDVVGYTRAATQLFGPAKRGDVFAFSGSSSDGDYREETLIHYRCPQLVAYVSANTYRQRVRNLVQFTIFDREWLTRIFDAEVRQRSRLLHSVRNLCEHFEQHPDGWINAPEIPETTRVVGNSKGTQGQLLNFVAYRGRNARESQNLRFHRYYEDSVVEVIEFENRYLAIEVHGYCDRLYSPHSLLAYRDQISEPSALKQDVLRCNSMLAQTYFQPKGTTIQTKPRHDEFLNVVMVHDWETQSGWRVRIRDNNVLFLIRPGPPPKL